MDASVVLTDPDNRSRVDSVRVSSIDNMLDLTACEAYIIVIHERNARAISLGERERVYV